MPEPEWDFADPAPPQQTVRTGAPEPTLTKVIYNNMMRDPEYRTKALGFREYVFGTNTSRQALAELSKLEKTDPEAFRIAQDVLEGARLYQEREGGLGKQIKGELTDFWQRQVRRPTQDVIGGKLSGQPLTLKNMQQMAEGFVVGGGQALSLGTAQADPWRRKWIGAPVGMIYGQHEGTKAWDELPPVEKRRQERKWREGGAVYDPTGEDPRSFVGIDPDYKGHYGRVGQNIGATTFLPSWALAGEASAGTTLRGVGAVAPKLLARPGMASAVRILGEGTPFAVTGAARAYGEGGGPQGMAVAMAQEALFNYAGFYVLSGMMKAGGGVIRKAGGPVGKALVEVHEQAVKWARQNPGATPRQQAAAADAIIKPRIKKAPSAVQKQLEREWRELRASVISRPQRVGRPQMTGERVGPARARQRMELDELDRRQMTRFRDPGQRASLPVPYQDLPMGPLSTPGTSRAAGQIIPHAEAGAEVLGMPLRLSSGRRVRGLLPPWEPDPNAPWALKQQAAWTERYGPHADFTILPGGKGIMGDRPEVPGRYIPAEEAAPAAGAPQADVPGRYAEGVVPRRTSQAVPHTSSGIKDAAKEPLRAGKANPLPEKGPIASQQEIDEAVEESANRLAEIIAESTGVPKKDTATRRTIMEGVRNRPDHEILAMDENPILQRMERPAQKPIPEPPAGPGAAAEATPPQVPPEAPVAEPDIRQQMNIAGEMEDVPRMAERPPDPPKPPARQENLFPDSGTIQDEAQVIWNPESAQLEDIYGNPVGKADEAVTLDPPPLIEPKPLVTDAGDERVLAAGQMKRLRISDLKMSREVQTRRELFDEDIVQGIVGNWDPQRFDPPIVIQVGDDYAKYGEGWITGPDGELVSTGPIVKGDFVRVRGYNRTEAARRMGVDVVEARVLSGDVVPYETASDLAFDQNVTELAPTELAVQIQKRLDRGVPPEELVSQIAQIKRAAEIDYYPFLSRLPDSMAAKVDAGQVPVGVGAAIGQVMAEFPDLHTAQAQRWFEGALRNDWRSHRTTYEWARGLAAGRQKAADDGQGSLWDIAYEAYEETRVRAKAAERDLRKINGILRGAKDPGSKISQLDLPVDDMKRLSVELTDDWKKAERALFDGKFKPLDYNEVPGPKGPKGGRRGAVLLDWPLAGLMSQISKIKPYLPDTAALKRAIILTDAHAISSVDSSLRRAPVQRYGEKLADALDEVRMTAAMEAADSSVTMQNSLATLPAPRQARVFRAMHGKLQWTQLNAAERRVAVDLRAQLDRVILDSASTGAAPMRVAMDWEPLGLLKTQPGMKNTGVFLDKQALTTVDADGFTHWNVSVRELMSMDEIPVVLADGTRTTVPRSVLQLPMQPDYMPQYIRPDILVKKQADVVDHLIKTGQVGNETEARRVIDMMREESMGHVGPLPEFWRHRNYILPDKWLLPPAERLARYFGRGWTRNMQTKFLGIGGAKMDRWLADAFNSDEAVEYAMSHGWATTEAEAQQFLRRHSGALEEAVRRQLGKWDSSALADGFRAMRSFHAMTALWGVAITNTPQFNNALLPTSLPSFAAGMRDAMTKMGREEASRAGVIFYQGWLETLGLGVTPGAGGQAGRIQNFGRMVVSDWYKLGPMERALRSVSGLTGGYHAEDMARQLLDDPTNQLVRQELRVLKLNPDTIIKNQGLNRMMKRRAMQALANRTQYLSQPIDLPILMSTEWGRTLMQYKTFMYQQTRFLANTVKGATPHQRARILMLLATVYPASGEMAQRLKGWISGRPATGVYFNRYIEAAAAAGAGAWAMELYNDAVRYGKFPEMTAPGLAALESLGNLGAYGLAKATRSTQEYTGAPTVREGEEAFRGRQAARAALRVAGLPGQVAARYGIPYSNIEDLTLRQQLEDNMRANVPWNLAFWHGPGSGPLEQIAPLTNTSETRRWYDRATPQKRFRFWKQADPNQRLSMLTLLNDEQRLNLLSAAWLPKEDIMRMRLELNEKDADKLGRMIQRAHKAEAEKKMQSLMDRAGAQP